MCTREMIIGRWRIVAWEQTYDDGRHILPLGKEIDGFIEYTQDQRMMCMLCRADTPDFTSFGPWDASDEERAAGYRSTLAYAGLYSIDADVVSHHVELSTFPNWRRKTLKRRIERCSRDELVLIARMEADTAEARTARLIWRKI